MWPTTAFACGLAIASFVILNCFTIGFFGRVLSTIFAIVSPPDFIKSSSPRSILSRISLDICTTYLTFGLITSLTLSILEMIGLR